MKRTTMLLIGAVLLLLAQAQAFAHEGETHTKRSKDAKMDKLHKLMAMYAQAQSSIDEALEKGDVAAVQVETGKILATIPELETAKPHKNAKKIEVFRKTASRFGGDIKNTATLVNKGDLAGAKDAFQSAKMRCKECHEKLK